MSSHLRQSYLLHGRAVLASAALAAVCAGVAPAPALAVPITTGTTLSVAYDQPVSGQPDLMATLGIFVTSMSSSQIDLAMTIANTTATSFSSGRLTGLGWDSSILPTNASDTSSVYSVYLNQNFPSNQSINLCLSSGSTCAGGASGGLSPGQSDAFNLILDGSFGTSTIDFSDFGAKFQTAYGSFEPTGTITGGCTSNCGGGGKVPEPASLPLLGVGLLGTLAFGRWRAKTADALPLGLA